MFSFLLAALVASAPISHSFLPETPAPITITPDNVDLFEAGTLAFKPDLESFDADPPAGPNGMVVTVRLWLDAKGQPLTCDIGQSTQTRVAQSACRQLMASAKFQIMPDFALPLHRGFLDMQFSFFKDRPEQTKATRVFAFPFAGYINTQIVYPPVDALVGHMLTPLDGAFRVAVATEDYPSIAIRYGWESHSLVLLGIDRTGTLRSCRPITGGPALRTSFLDSYTCVLFMRRGRFEFLPSAPEFDGLRYIRQSMNWKMPE